MRYFGGTPNKFNSSRTCEKCGKEFPFIGNKSFCCYCGHTSGMEDDYDFKTYEDLKKLRKPLSTKLISKIVIFLVVVTILASIGLQLIPGGTSIPFNKILTFVFPAIVALMFVATFMSIFGKSEIKYRYFYKQIVLNDVHRKIMQVNKFSMPEGISEDIIEDSQLIPPVEMELTDLLEGEYNNILFSSCHVYDCYTSDDSDGHTRVSDIFRGRWYVINLNQNCGPQVRFLDKKFNTKYSVTKKPNSVSIRSKNTNKEKYSQPTNDIEFNKLFNTFVTSEYAANNYALSSGILQRVLRLKEETSSVVLVSVKNNILQVGIADSNEMMEPPSRQYEPEKIREKLIRELNAIMALATELNNQGGF